MNRVGIIGGLGPASTLDYYSGIINGYRMRANDGNYPEIVINSVNMAQVLSYVTNKEWDSLEKLLLDAISDLANAGAEFAAIASNTPHIVFDRVQQESVLPLNSIVDATCACIQQKGCRKVVVIGTRFTMSSGLYSNALEKYGITAIVPSEAEQLAIHDIIFPKLEDGIVVPEDKGKMLAIADSLLINNSADGLVLGCTELPLMIKGCDLDRLIFNTTQIHIESIVRSI